MAGNTNSPSPLPPLGTCVKIIGDLKADEGRCLLRYLIFESNTFFKAITNIQSILITLRVIEIGSRLLPELAAALSLDNSSQPSPPQSASAPPLPPPRPNSAPLLPANFSRPPSTRRRHSLPLCNSDLGLCFSWLKICEVPPPNLKDEVKNEENIVVLLRESSKRKWELSVIYGGGGGLEEEKEKEV